MVHFPQALVILIGFCFHDQALQLRCYQRPLSYLTFKYFIPDMYVSCALNVISTVIITGSIPLRWTFSPRGCQLPSNRSDMIYMMYILIDIFFIDNL
jgi:hypothetical protein